MTRTISDVERCAVEHENETGDSLEIADAVLAP